MKLFRAALILALFLLTAPVSHAAITCVADDDICDATVYTVSGWNADFPIPSDVPLVSFYAKGGKGGDGSKYSKLSGGGGGGGACAYWLSSPGVYTYLVCVGGGGGGGHYDQSGRSRPGGLGGSTVNAPTPTGGVGLGGLGRDNANGFAGIKNGYGGAGGNYLNLRAGAGGEPGHGGYANQARFGLSGGAGGGGGGGNIFTSAGDGADYRTITPGGTQLGGGWGCVYGGGGGGGYGGGGSGGAGTGYYLSDGYSAGGGGSSYFHPSLSAPDAQGFVSVPTSAFGPATSGGIGFDGKGWTVRLAAGIGGFNSCMGVTAINFGEFGTTTMKYLCSAKRGQSCGSLVPNSCGDPNPYAVYDCTERCVDYSTGELATPAERPPIACSTPNICGQTATGTVACDGTCSATPPALPASYGTLCTSGANACGQTSTGIIQCDSTCSATAPTDPFNYGTSCSLTSLPNDCGKTVTVAGSGTIGCDSFTCTGTRPDPPPNSTCAPTAPTINALYKSGSFRGPSVLGYDPLGYQLYAQSVSPANYDLTYYFEWSKDGINWTGDPSPPIGSWATLP